MSRGSANNRWTVHFHRVARGYKNARGPADEETVRQALASRAARPLRDGTPFMIGPDGRPDALLNDYFVHGPGGRLRGASPRTYAYRICSALNVLSAWGVSWREATTEDIEDLRTWRVFDERNPQRVDEQTWSKQAQALQSLYGWATRYDVKSPMLDGIEGRSLGGAYHSSAAVKWFDPDAYALWRNVAFLGLLPDGTEDAGFRGLNAQRDAAFADTLYRTGLRVQEGGTILADVEWPLEHDHRRFVKLRLAAACAKGGKARDYWVPQSVLSTVRGYTLGERAESILRGQNTYRSLADKLIIDRATRGALYVRDAAGTISMRSIGDLTVAERGRLFWERDGLLEPAVLWLNRDGLPRCHASWSKTFDRANERVSRLGVRLSRLTPHMLRHSFALRWFIVARLLWQRRVAFLSEDETHDLREEMGSHWGLVQTMLGHTNPATTMNIYLEPFQSLDIEVLLDHAADESVTDLMAALLHTHPRVQSATVS